jgi:hypothetical protein
MELFIASDGSAWEAASLLESVKNRATILGAVVNVNAADGANRLACSIPRKGLEGIWA